MTTTKTATAPKNPATEVFPTAKASLLGTADVGARKVARMADLLAHKA